jgi:hypothetical protein
MKVALLVDNMTVARWQADALQLLGDDVQFKVYNCTNPRRRRRRATYLPYYLVNFASLRTELTRKGDLPDAARAAPKIDFRRENEGNWDRLPQWVIDEINRDQPVAVVKFGLGLLRIPQDLSRPVLSYHHGDPRSFRGRPAGFYELLTGAEALGQIIQVLSNRLDGGAVLAFAQTRLHRHSYRATMHDSYAASRFLLRQAIASLREGRIQEIVPVGTLYQLPSIGLVLRFTVRLAVAKIRRLAYGALMEKEWRVAEAPMTSGFRPPFVDPVDPSKWREIDRPSQYQFLADPFPLPDGSGILVEALRSSTGLGEIIALQGKHYKRLLGGSGHFSYPATFTTKEGQWLLPEVSEWSPPRLYSIENNSVEEIGVLNMPHHYRLVDPTFLEWKGKIFLFANHLSDPDGVLRLWTANTILDQFKEHPASPVLMSPIGGRMGGAFITADGLLYRVGQDGSRAYGDGVLFFQIDELSAASYRERLIGKLRFRDFLGPHTINLGSRSVLFDFYRHRLRPLAGFRRVQRRLAHK